VIESKFKHSNLQKKQKEIPHQEARMLNMLPKHLQIPSLHKKLNHLDHPLKIKQQDGEESQINPE
jgi:hypothetical protein